MELEIKLNFEIFSLGMNRDSRSGGLWLLKTWRAEVTTGKILEKERSSKVLQYGAKIL